MLYFHSNFWTKEEEEKKIQWIYRHKLNDEIFIKIVGYISHSSFHFQVILISYCTKTVFVTNLFMHFCCHGLKQYFRLTNELRIHIIHSSGNTFRFFFSAKVHDEPFTKFKMWIMKPNVKFIITKHMESIHIYVIWNSHLCSNIYKICRLCFFFFLLLIKSKTYIVSEIWGSGLFQMCSTSAVILFCIFILIYDNFP